MARVAELPLRERGVCCPPARRARPERVEDQSRILKALADPTRLEMILMLRASPESVCVCDFAMAFGLAQPTVSHHMGVLREAGLVEVTKRGIWSHYALAPLSGATRRIVESLG